VALKVCAMVTKGGHPVSRMLEEEARVQMMVKHPNIIAVHNHFIYKDNYVIVMQPAKASPFLAPVPPLHPVPARAGAASRPITTAP